MTLQKEPLRHWGTCLTELASSWDTQWWQDCRIKAATLADSNLFCCCLRVLKQNTPKSYVFFKNRIYRMRIFEPCCTKHYLLRTLQNKILIHLHVSRISSEWICSARMTTKQNYFPVKLVYAIFGIFHNITRQLCTAQYWRRPICLRAGAGTVW